MEYGTEVVRKHRKDPDPVFGYVIPPLYEIRPEYLMVRWSNGLTLVHLKGELREVREQDKPNKG